MLAACEGADYNILYGGGTFQVGADHPRITITAGGYTSTAAGRYQILSRTWDAFIKAKGPHRFDEAGQDACALWLIEDRHATADVENGRLREAIEKTCRVWASLPGAPYGQPTRSYAYCEQHYLAAGGVLNSATNVAAPATGTTVPVSGTGIASGGNAPPIHNADSVSQAIPKGPTMGAALALLPLLAQFIPQIMTLIKPGSQSTAKDAAIAQTVLNTVVQAAGVVAPGQPATAGSVGAAIDKMTADPSLAQQVQQAVVTHPEVMSALVVEVGAGGIAAARTFNADPLQIPFYKNPGFVVACLLIPLIYIVVSRVMFADGYSEQLKTVVVTAILSGLLGALTGFYFGSSLSSARKDELAAK